MTTNMMDESTLEAHLARAGDHLRADRMADATLEIEAALAIAPEDLRARNLLGLLHFRAGRFAEAQWVYQELLAQRTDDMSLRLNLGLVELRLNHPQEAVEHLALVVDAEPDNKRAQAYYGLALMRAGHLVEARAVLSGAGQADLVRQVDNLIAAQAAGRAAAASTAKAEAAAATATAEAHAAEARRAEGGPRLVVDDADEDEEDGAQSASGTTPPPVPADAPRRNTQPPSVDVTATRVATPSEAPRRPTIPPIPESNGGERRRTVPPPEAAPTRTTAPPLPEFTVSRPKAQPQSMPGAEPPSRAPRGPAPESRPSVASAPRQPAESRPGLPSAEAHAEPTRRPAPPPLPGDARSKITAPLGAPVADLPARQNALSDEGRSRANDNASFVHWPATQSQTARSTPSMAIPQGAAVAPARDPESAQDPQWDGGDDQAVPDRIVGGRQTAPYRGRVAQPLNEVEMDYDARMAMAEARRAAAAGARVLEKDQPFAPAESAGGAAGSTGEWYARSAAQGLPSPSRAPRPSQPGEERGLRLPMGAAFGPQPLSSFVRSHEIQPPPDGSAFGITADGLLVVRVLGQLPTRSIGVVVSAGALDFVPLMRRARGRALEEPFGEGAAGLYRATGQGLMVISPLGGHFVALALMDESIYLRESATFAFEDDLHWENGRIPGAGPASGHPGLPDELARVVQFRGTGQLVMHTVRLLYTVRLQAGQTSYIEVERLVGWSGRIIPALLAQDGAPTPYVECTGEGFLLVEPPPNAPMQYGPVEASPAAAAQAAPPAGAAPGTDPDLADENPRDL